MIRFAMPVLFPLNKRHIKQMLCERVYFARLYVSIRILTFIGHVETCSLCIWVRACFLYNKEMLGRYNSEARFSCA